MILPMAMWLSPFVMSTIGIAVSESLNTIALLHELTESAYIKERVP